MFKCKEPGCGKTVRKLSDIRNCTKCRAVGRAQKVERVHDDDDGDDLLTLAVVAFLFSGSEHPFEPHESDADPLRGGGGEFSGGGASSSFDTPELSNSPDSSDSSDSPSSDSSSDSSSGSSDSSSSSSE